MNTIYVIDSYTNKSKTTKKVKKTSNMGEDGTKSVNNHEIMDYIFDKREQIPNDIFLTLSNLLKKNEENIKNPTKYFKLKYSLTEIISIAQNFPTEDCIDLNSNELGPTDIGLNLTTRYRSDVRTIIVKGEKESTNRLHIDDILNGVVQLNYCEMNDTWEVGLKIGAVLVVSRCLTGQHQEDVSHITSSMTVMNIEEFDPSTDNPSLM
tara:strand:+ start:37 stop:660 length:624 start_codon:yes stop_codon:yes gene_type:complete